MNASEKRLHPRRLHTRIVYLQREQTEMSRPDRFVSMAWGIDISQSGIGLITRRALHEKDIVNLIFSPSSLTALPHIRAEIVWAMPNKTRYRCGLRFLL